MIAKIKLHQSKFCSAHRKEQKRDNLYIDISEDDAFNMDYRIRVTDVLERSMLLAYNLQITTTGHFCKKRKGGKYGHSSHIVAKTRIQRFYSMIATSNKLLLWSRNLFYRSLLLFLKKIKEKLVKFKIY